MEYQKNIFGESVPAKVVGLQILLNTLFGERDFIPCNAEFCEQELKRSEVYLHKDKPYCRDCYIEVSGIEVRECWECLETIIFEGEYKEDFVEVDVFDSPFDTVPLKQFFHATEEYDEDQNCYRRAFDTGWGDFRLFVCDDCGRIINRQCPSNGWHSYVKTIDYDGNEICLDCYEKDILENGVPFESFKSGKVEGMFAPKAEENGYEVVEGFKMFFINNRSSANEYCKKAIELIYAGYNILNDYERMAIGGLEGYVTMWAKKVRGADLKFKPISEECKGEKDSEDGSCSCYKYQN